ncbi:MAG: hypothetical protein R2857_10530 [Vampirovibrionales bacterium]
MPKPMVHRRSVGPMGWNRPSRRVEAETGWSKVDVPAGTLDSIKPVFAIDNGQLALSLVQLYGWPTGRTSRDKGG